MQRRTLLPKKRFAWMEAHHNLEEEEEEVEEDGGGGGRGGGGGAFCMGGSPSQLGAVVK